MVGRHVALVGEEDEPAASRSGRGGVRVMDAAVALMGDYDDPPFYRLCVPRTEAVSVRAGSGWVGASHRSNWAAAPAAISAGESSFGIEPPLSATEKQPRFEIAS